MIRFPLKVIWLPSLPFYFLTDKCFFRPLVILVTDTKPGKGADGLDKGPFLFLESSIRRIIEMAGIAGIFSLLGLMMMTVTDVCMRFFFNRPISASTEFTGYLMVSTGFLGVAWCGLMGGHITIDLLAHKFSKRGLAITDAANYIIVIGMSALIAWQGYVQSMNLRKMNVRSVLTDIPTFPFYLLVSFGFLLLLLAAVILLVPAVRRIKK